MFILVGSFIGLVLSIYGVFEIFWLHFVYICNVKWYILQLAPPLKMNKALTTEKDLKRTTENWKPNKVELNDSKEIKKKLRK